LLAEDLRGFAFEAFRACGRLSKICGMLRFGLALGCQRRFWLVGGSRRAIFGNVLSRAARFCVLILLIISVGGQWALLQSAAWMGMLIDYSRDSSIKIAVSKTFDGKHPCCLCKAIAEGKKSEQKKEMQKSEGKIDFFLSEDICAQFFPPAMRPSMTLSPVPTFWQSRPPKPVPRTV
jgi:hypothetical protein